MKTPNFNITDLSNDFLVNPLTGDVSIKKNIDAIKQSMKNLLLMDQFDKPFNPEINANLKQYLFENIPFGILKTILDEKIRFILENYEKRIIVKNVELQFKPEQNYIQIDISFSLKNTSEETEQFLRVNLERTR